MGDSSQTQESQATQRTKTEPWKQTIPLLKSIIGQVEPLAANANVTPTQSAALSRLGTAASGLPNFGQDAANLTKDYLTGDPTGLLKPALSSYNEAIAPLAGAPLDPSQNPYTKSIIDTITQDVNNNVNGLFAGAGRDLSGLHAQYLARGLAQGLAPTLFNQYNTNVQNRENAAGGLLSAAGTTAQTMSGNQAQGLNFAAAQPGLALTPAQAGYDVANATFSQPYQNLAQPLALTLPIAGLGSQSKASSQGTTTSANDPSLLSEIGQGVSIFGNLFGASSPWGAYGAFR